MKRALLRLMLSIFGLVTVSIPVSSVIGHILPPERAGVFVFFTDYHATRIAWVDMRTRISYQREYAGIEPTESGTTADCHLQVTRRDDDTRHLSILDLHTGQVRLDIPVSQVFPDGVFSPDEGYRWVLYAEPDEPHQLQRLIVNINTGRRLLLPLVMGSYARAQWSPDSQDVLEFISGPPQGATDYRATGADIPAFIVNVTTGERITLPAAQFYPGAWSPDSRRVALVQQSGAVVVVDVSGNEQSRFTQYNDIWQIRWRDNSHLLVMGRSVDVNTNPAVPGSIVLWSPDDATAQYSPLELDRNVYRLLSPDGSLIYDEPSDAPPGIYDTQTGAAIIHEALYRPILGAMRWSGDNRYLLSVYGTHGDARLQIADTVTRQVTQYTIMPGNSYAALDDTANDFGYFNGSIPRLSRLRLTDVGIVVDELDRPDADSGMWCLMGDAP